MPKAAAAGPGDVDSPSVSGLHCTTFRALAALSGQVPTLGIVEGYCFAGNAALLGSCDYVISTRAASIGMGGPAMIEGGGLGVVAPDDVGPAETLARAGGIDLLVDDEAQATHEARRILAWHQGALPDAGAADQQALRDAIPLGRNAVFDPRTIIHTLADRDSVIELRALYGLGVVTVLARLGGHPVAIAATKPRHLAGALDVAGCDKLARFMQLADAAGHPLITLVDTPGFMVGPASEAQGMLRHAGRVFVTAAALRVPVVSVVLRRGFGLGAMAFTGGHFHAPVATAAWPQAEFGPMGLEGAVRLGFRKELAAVQGAERDALFERLLSGMRERGRALNVASHLEIDDVIDPAAHARLAAARAGHDAPTGPAAAARFRRHLVAPLDLPPSTNHDKETEMFRTAIAGSLPKPGWLAETQQAVAALGARGRRRCARPSSTPR